MPGVTTGILCNALPLSAEHVKSIEKDVLEKQETFAYIDENSELCFSLPSEPDVIKDLAWNNAYELCNVEGTLTKHAYRKTGLETFTLDKTFIKNRVEDSWSDPTMSTERLEGDGQEFYTAAPSTLSFRSTAPLNEFQNVQINGQTVDPSNYTLEEGSTIVKLSHEYLKTLDVGSYELSVVSSSKTAKGDFTVAAPELNEYGFYYNQPYYIEDTQVGNLDNSAMLSGAFIISTNNTMHVLNAEADTLTETTLTCENNIYIFDFGGATLTGSFTSNGASFVTSKVFIAGGGWMPDYNGNDHVEFTLNTEAVCSDSEYLYYISGIHDCLVALPINKNKSSYNLPKIHIRDNAVTGFAHAAFSYNTQLTSLDFMPEGLTKIYNMLCYDCTSLTSVTIPNSVINIGSYAFNGCVNLKNINFEGTVTQWNTITKGDNWSLGIQATYIQCLDGQVAL